jgi:hypothetical protein
MNDGDYQAELERAREARLRAEQQDLDRKESEERARRARQKLVESWAESPPPLIENHLRTLRFMGLASEDIERLRLEVHSEVPLSTSELSRGVYVIKKAEALVAERAKDREKQVADDLHQSAARERMRRDGVFLPADLPGPVGTLIRARLSESFDRLLRFAANVEAERDREREARSAAVDSLSRNSREALADATLAVELSRERYELEKKKFLDLRAQFEKDGVRPTIERMNEILGELTQATLMSSFVDGVAGEFESAGRAFFETIDAAMVTVRAKGELHRELSELDAKIGLRQASKVVFAELGGGVEAFLLKMLRERVRAMLSPQTRKLLFGDHVPDMPLVDPFVAFHGSKM